MGFRAKLLPTKATPVKERSGPCRKIQTARGVWEARSREEKKRQIAIVPAIERGSRDEGFPLAENTNHKWSDAREFDQGKSKVWESWGVDEGILI